MVKLSRYVVEDGETMVKTMVNIVVWILFLEYVLDVKLCVLTLKTVQ